MQSALILISQLLLLYSLNFLAIA